MRFGSGRRKRRERSADTSELLSAKLQEVQKKHDELLVELAEAQRKVADSGSTRRQFEDQLKALQGRPEAEGIAEGYEQAMVSEKKLISYESEVRKKLDTMDDLAPQPRLDAEQLRTGATQFVSSGMVA
ncbi:hypothetical protein E1281_18325 [Actinomadura sp. KC345]|uniref:hypothetical protein n=1 Tax=Actinomadura sp. KC345 TaxID=2530371 RepID=UPI0010507B09|nr:hypothetical protein [Actinomadura sp. KC345]TDC53010.1 hypothetical protein E1281_18325 [Actinomadura sp. KC345]